MSMHFPNVAAPNQSPAARDDDRPLLPARALGPEQVLLSMSLPDPEALFDTVARQACRPGGPTHSQVLRRLQGRHARQSAQLAHGLALPHAAVPALSAPMALYLRFTQPVPVPDAPPMRDALALLVPLPGLASDHAVLARLQRLLSDRAVLRRLRACADAEAVHAFFTRWR